MNITKYKLFDENKYLWFLYNSKNNIKLISSDNNILTSKIFLKHNIKKYIKNKKNNQEFTIYLLQIKYKNKISKLFPTNYYFIIKPFKLIFHYKSKNVRLYRNYEFPIIIFYNKNKQIKKEYITKMIYKIYSKNIITKPLDFKFYSDL